MSTLEYCITIRGHFSVNIKAVKPEFPNRIKLKIASARHTKIIYPIMDGEWTSLEKTFNGELKGL
jgi:hypothetical protein